MSDSRTLVQRDFNAFEGGSLEPMRNFCVTPESFIYELLPHSMGVPPKNLEEYITWIAGGLSGFKGGKLSVRTLHMQACGSTLMLEIIEFFETQGSNRAVVHAKGVNSFGVNGAP
ncbi:hypothetical protein EXIGLDRAFT_784398 [Exidia glandulosa HHB12029]|uniref:Uncharacterized protein n=1 Tax=Exidia glandulosa HHB12029 TaxID=1314781 RepID=A0A166MH76_EXIGL|nr:hypothetical protein EXIGLDRAFT_784398 [Exidia glandulosa HHB12029]